MTRVIFGFLLALAAGEYAQSKTRSDAEVQSFAAANGTPTLSSCGTSPSLSAGSTGRTGAVTAGTGVVTSCTLTFSEAWPKAPNCNITPSGVAVSAGITSAATTNVVVGFSASVGGSSFYYNCGGNP